MQKKIRIFCKISGRLPYRRQFAENTHESNIMNILEPRTSFQPVATLARVGMPARTSDAPRSPAEAVRLAVNSVDCRPLQPVAPPGAGLAYQPESLLALIVYCYTRGVYGSAEIEDSLWRDRELRELAGHDVPDAKMLRRFRRLNRECLHECLSVALGFLTGPGGTTGWEGVSRQNLLAGEAHRRIARAMFIDQMESEGCDF